jgi:hypothetical protein
MRGPRRKADVASTEGWAHIGNRHQGGESGPPGSRHLLKTAMHENTILAHERDQVGKRRQRHDIQIVFEVDVRIGPSLEQGMRDLERHAGAAKIGKPAVSLRINQCRAIGPFARDFVMIENNHIGTAFSDRGDFTRRVRAAVHRD